MLSLILAIGGEFVPLVLLSGLAGLILRPAIYIAVLILGIWGRSDVQASDQLGRIQARVSISGTPSTWLGSSLGCSSMPSSGGGNGQRAHTAGLPQHADTLRPESPVLLAADQ